MLLDSLPSNTGIEMSASRVRDGFGDLSVYFCGETDSWLQSGLGVNVRFSRYRSIALNCAPHSLLNQAGGVPSGSLRRVSVQSCRDDLRRQAKLVRFRSTEEELAELGVICHFGPIPVGTEYFSLEISDAGSAGVMFLVVPSMAEQKAAHWASTRRISWSAA
jgi:hypothetical protein